MKEVWNKSNWNDDEKRIELIEKNKIIWQMKKITNKKRNNIYIFLIYLLIISLWVHYLIIPCFCLVYTFKYVTMYFRNWVVTRYEC